MVVVLLNEIESYTLAMRNVKLTNTRVTEIPAYLSDLNTARVPFAFFSANFFCFERR